MPAAPPHSPPTLSQSLTPATHYSPATANPVPITAYGTFPHPASPTHLLQSTPPLHLLIWSPLPTPPYSLQRFQRSTALSNEITFTFLVSHHNYSTNTLRSPSPLPKDTLTSLEKIFDPPNLHRAFTPHQTRHQNPTSLSNFPISPPADPMIVLLLWPT